MITLSAGEASVVLAPEAGGAVLGWRIGRQPLLRATDPTALLRGRGRGMGAFPLVPFSNRIAGGRFAFGGREYRLARADTSFPIPIHGLGWVRPWQLAAVSERAADLRLVHPATEADRALWPFAFAADLRVALTATTLSIGLRLVNRHDGPAPAGLGLHPFFPRTAAASLRFAATGVWRATPERLPTVHVPVPPEWDHRAGLKIGTVALDDVFTGWDGRAEVTLAPVAPVSEPVTITLTASPIFRHLVIYTPPGAGYFCVEPVSHMTDAIHHLADRTDTGLAVLAPGGALEGEIGFAVRGA
ncbi:MAG: aldose 1-epimerase [Rhodospirillales bacterium]|jgi:aldose 1-epimerase|nr:aldose 1-epimerase [Rhodospirillales bacterium]